MSAFTRGNTIVVVRCRWICAGITEHADCPPSFPGEFAAQQSIVRAMRIVKKEVLRLIGTWMSQAADPAAVRVYVCI